MNRVKLSAVAAFAAACVQYPVLARAGDAGETSAPSSPVVTQSCFVGDNIFNCAVRGDNDPQTYAASQPASLAYTANNAGADSYAIQAAIRVQHDLGWSFLNLKGLWHKNNQQKKEQDNLMLSAGLQFEASNVDAVFDAWEKSGKTTRGSVRSVYVDTDVGFNRKAQFADLKAPACVANPLLVACGTQHLETLRITAVAAPYMSEWEALELTDGGSYYIFAPVAGLFYDKALNEDVVLLSGTAAKGSVFGVSAGAAFAFSPGVFKNKWELKVSGQIIEALDRSAGRANDFQKSSAQFTAGISYALAGSYLNQKDANTWIPALSVTYTDGSDTLKGKAKQDTIVIGLTVKY